MSRSKRRVVQRSRSTRYEPPRRYLDGTEIPAAIRDLVPTTEPVTYLGDRSQIQGFATYTFEELPELAHAVLIADVLGGVHGVRCFDSARSWRLGEVADQVVTEVEDFAYPTCLLYLARGDGFPGDARTQWNELRFWHPGPPFLLDAFVVAPERGLLWSYAERFAAPIPGRDGDACGAQ